MLARLVGVYESGSGRLHIRLEDRQIHLEPEGASGSEPLIAGSETAFYFSFQALSWESITDEIGQAIDIQLAGQPETLGTRVE